MPFVQPTFGAADGARVGITGLYGSLAPVIASNGMTRLGANIGAYPPYGVIGTTVSAGFSAGFASPGTSMLTVIVAGVATTCRAFTEAIGGYSQARAELSITISEFALVFAEGFSGGKGIRRATRTRTVGFNPTIMYDDRGIVLGYNLRMNDGAPFSTVAGMPVVAGRFYEVMISVVQSAVCEGVSGLAVAGSNVQFDFSPVFFSFV